MVYLMKKENLKNVVFGNLPAVTFITETNEKTIEKFLTEVPTKLVEKEETVVVWEGDLILIDDEEKLMLEII